MRGTNFAAFAYFGNAYLPEASPTGPRVGVFGEPNEGCASDP